MVPTVLGPLATGHIWPYRPAMALNVLPQHATCQSTYGRGAPRSINKCEPITLNCGEVWSGVDSVCLIRHTWSGAHGAQPVAAGREASVRGWRGGGGWDPWLRHTAILGMSPLRDPLLGD